MCIRGRHFTQSPGVSVRPFRFRVKSSIGLPSLQTPVTSLGVPRPPCEQLVRSPRVSWNPPLRFNNLLEQVTELREVLYLRLRFSYKGYEWWWDKRHIGQRSWTYSSRALCLWNQGTPPPSTSCVHNLGSSTELQCPYFLLRFHSIGMIGWVLQYLTELDLQPSLPSLEVRLTSPGSRVL